MNQLGDTLRENRPSQNEHFTQRVQFLIAVRTGDLSTVRCGVALKRDPGFSLKRDPARTGSGHGLSRWSGGQVSRCRACP